MTDVLAESMKLHSLPKLQDKMNTALAMLERDFHCSAGNLYGY